MEEHFNQGVMAWRNRAPFTDMSSFNDEGRRGYMMGVFAEMEAPNGAHKFDAFFDKDGQAKTEAAKGPDLCRSETGDQVSCDTPGAKPNGGPTFRGGGREEVAICRYVSGFSRP